MRTKRNSLVKPTTYEEPSLADFYLQGNHGRPLFAGLKPPSLADFYLQGNHGYSLPGQESRQSLADFYLQGNHGLHF